MKSGPLFTVCFVILASSNGWSQQAPVSDGNHTKDGKRPQVLPDAAAKVNVYRGQSVRSCERALKRYREVERQLAELEATMPFIQQFDLVKRTIDEINETLKKSSEDVSTVADKIGQLREFVGETNDELERTLNSPVWARSIARTPAERPVATPDAGETGPLGQIEGGLGRAKEMMDEVLAVTEKAGKALAVLDEALEARNASATEQLEAFQKYFTTVAESIPGQFIKRIPGLGQLLELYAEAIGLIAQSVGNIEESRRRINEMARGAGLEDIYRSWETTPAQRLNRKRQLLDQELRELAQELLDCDIDPDDTSDPATRELKREIEAARGLARRACFSALSSLQDGWSTRDAALQRLRRFYPKPDLFDAARYGDELDLNEELDLAARRHEEWKQKLNLSSLEQEIEQLEREAAVIEERFQRFRRGELRLSTDEQIELNQELQETGETLQNRRDLYSRNLSALEAREPRLREAKAGQHRVLELSSTYDECRREWLEREAEAKGWPEWRYQSENEDLYPDWYRQRTAEIHAVKVFDAVPRTSSDRFKDQLQLDIAIPPPHPYDTIPYHVARPFQTTLARSPAERIVIASTPDGTGAWQIDNFLFFQIRTRSRTDVFVVGGVGPVEFGGQSVRNLGTDFSQQPLDLTAYIPPDIPVEITIYALDFGVVGYVSDVYLVTLP